MDRFDAPATAALYERVLSGRIDADTERWLVEGLRLFDRHEGVLPLERCLRIPTPAQRQLAERDFWIREIGELVEEARPTHRAKRVAGLLESFTGRGPWRQWRELAEPPDGATELQRAMFYAARAIGDKGIVPKWRQVQRVLNVVTEAPSSDNESALP